MTNDRKVKCRQCKEWLLKSEAYCEQQKSSNAYFHDNCFKDLEKKRIEKQELDKVCQYIKVKFLGYEEKQLVPKFLFERIVGLHSGQYAIKRDSKIFLSENGYEYDVIYKTCLLFKAEITYMLSKGGFKDERHMINSIMSVLQREINNVYERIKTKKRTDEQLEITTERLIDEFNQPQSEYVKTEKNNKLFERFKDRI